MSNMLDINSLEVHFSSFKLGPLNFELPKGRVLAYIGPNASGKTTTIKTILGVYRPNKGKILFDGEEISSAKSKRIWVNRVGVVYDDMIQWSNLRVIDYLKFLSDMYDVWDESLQNKLIKRLSIDEKEIIAKMSFGSKTKLSIITALCHKPKLLLLDEPTSGLDPFSRNELMDILFEFMQNEENSIIYSSHIIPEIDKIADEIAILIDGQIYTHAEKSELIEKWRKLSIHSINELPKMDEVIEINKNGLETILTTQDYEFTKTRMAQKGIEVRNESYMSLENIILAIMKSKKYYDIDD